MRSDVLFQKAVALMQSLPVSRERQSYVMPFIAPETL
jgi:hypothetical protein